MLLLAFDSSSKNKESYLFTLDNLLANRQQYVTIKQKKISSYIMLLRISKGYQRYQIYADLYQQYKSYRLDSALYYAKLSIKIAKKNNNTADLENSIMNLSEAMKKMGQLQEALSLLKQINPDSPTLNLHYYYHLYHSVNYMLYLNSFTDDEKNKYKSKVLYYLTLLISNKQKDTYNYVCNKSEEYRLKGKPNKALNLLLGYIRIHPKEVINNSFLSYSLAETYKDLKMEKEEKYYLTLTAISDLLNTKKEYMALQQLAVLLYNEGDISRAYKYITYSMQDIVFCHARCRMSYVSEVLPIISATYESKMKSEANLRTISIIIISVLLIFFIVVYIKLLKRNHELTYMQNSLDLRNAELSALNQRLVELNKQLSESNRIKEEYIVQLFDLCSSYINKQKVSRLSMNRKIIAGKVNEVRKELSDTSMELEELKAFLHHFDEIFLKLFPTFIQTFNSLLVSGQEIEPKDSEFLSPELRIYALIRLGINDSAKIAKLLHYSVQTVYNYRQKIRNRLAVSKDEFINDLFRLIN